MALVDKSGSNFPSTGPFTGSSTGPSTGPSTSGADARTRPEWYSDRFLNFTVPGDTGSVRLGSIGLKLSDPDQRALIEKLDENPEKVIAALLAALEVNYRDATKKPKGMSFLSELD